MNKILLLAPMASVHEGFNIACIKALLELKVDLHFAANFSMNAHTQEYGEKLQQQGFTVHDIPFVRGSLLANFRCIPMLMSLFASENFDLVHSHTETGGVLTRFAIGSNKKTKYIYTPHGMSFWKDSSFKTQYIYRPVERWICRGMVGNIAINLEELSVLQNWNARTAYFIHGIGVNVAKYQHTIDDKTAKKDSLGVPADAKVLLSVGELNDNKNHKIILDALTKIDLVSHNLYYVVCGADKSDGFLAQYAKDSGLDARVVLAGYRNDMNEIYPIADYLAFPSFHEGLPVSVMEAMSNGLPILASKIRGITDLIEDGVGGFLYEPIDAEGFANGLQRFLDDESLCKNMGQTNQRNILMYDISKVEKEMFNIYYHILY